MAAHAVGQTFDEYRAFASAAFLARLLSSPSRTAKRSLPSTVLAGNSIGLRVLR